MDGLLPRNLRCLNVVVVQARLLVVGERKESEWLALIVGGDCIKSASKWGRQERCRRIYINLLRRVHQMFHM